MSEELSLKNNEMHKNFEELVSLMPTQEVAYTIQGRRQDFHGGVSEEVRSKRARKNSKLRPFLPYLPVTVHCSDDLLACLQRKRSKNN